MVNKALKVGLIGLGTVGGGVLKVLQQNSDEIQSRAGLPIVLQKIADKNASRLAEIVPSQIATTTDAMEIVHDPEIDVVIELIGGTSSAKTIMLEAIQQKKHVVTANKALLALHGNELFDLAQKNGVMLGFEASVAGGIPIIKALKEGLSANRIEWLAGIINGTTNFILTEMRDTGQEFTDVLKKAQNLGYAEADPTFDVEGIDAAHKLMIMSAIAFDIPMQFDKIYTEGITQLTRQDINYAFELGYRIKLLGIAKRGNKGIELRVHPALIPHRRLIANVDGAMNAVVVKGNAVGPTLYYGAGAGELPTASSVVADLIDIARYQFISVIPSALGRQGKSGDSLPPKFLAITEIITPYYLRVKVLNRSGVLAEITKILSERQISIDAMLQKESLDDTAEMVVLTHSTQEGNMDTAISAIQNLSIVQEKVTKIRIETFSS